MKRRNFIGGILGGLTALPFIAKSSANPHLGREEVVLTHKESRSGIRCTDVRIVVSDVRDFQDSKVGEEAFLRIIQKNRNIPRAL